MLNNEMPRDRTDPKTTLHLIARDPVKLLGEATHCHDPLIRSSRGVCDADQIVVCRGHVGIRKPCVAEVKAARQMQNRYRLAIKIRPDERRSLIPPFPSGLGGLARLIIQEAPQLPTPRRVLELAQRLRLD